MSNLFVYTLRFTGRDCNICQDSCATGQRIYEHSTCKNHFHVACLLPWMEHHNTCPTCRGSWNERLPVEEEPVGVPSTSWWFTMPSIMDHVLTYAFLHIIMKRRAVIMSVNNVLDAAHVTVDRSESCRPYRLCIYDDMVESFDTMRAAYERYHERIPKLLNCRDAIDEPWRLTPVRAMVKALILMPIIKRIAAL